MALGSNSVIVRAMRTGRALAVVAAAALALAAQAEDPLGPMGKFFHKLGLFPDIQVYGQNTLTFQRHRVEGSVESFHGQRWDTDTLLTQSSLHAEGTIWKEFGFELDFSSSGWGPSYTRWVVGYVGHDTAVYYGDLNVDLAGNYFLAFRKNLRGWQVDQVLPGGGRARYFRSREKGIVRRQSFPGNNTPGPYYLTFTPIVEGSEVVKVDEQVMQFGRDYRLDYETGELRFEPVDGPPRIIPSTSMISVTYLSYGYGSTPGILQGVRAELPLFKRRVTVGFTKVTEDRLGPGQRDTVGYHEDFYYGSGTTGPFDTSFRPIIPDGATVVYHGQRQTIERALVVLVDNVEQREGVDYDAYRNLGRIIFRRAVPPTSLVVIKYYYELSAYTPSYDSDVWGVDLRWAINPRTSLHYDLASSQGGTSGKPGTAQRLFLGFTGQRLSLSAEWRDIEPSFSFLNAVGFYRHDTGYQAQLQWDIAEGTSLYMYQSRFRASTGYSFGYSGFYGGEGFIPSSPYGEILPQAGLSQAWEKQANGEVGLSVIARRRAIGLRYAKPRRPAFQVQWQEMTNFQPGSSLSRYRAEQVQMQWIPTNKPFSLSLSWARTKQTAWRIAASQEPSSTATSTKQFLASATYSPGHRLSLSANFGRVTTGGLTGSSVATNLQLAARWTPSDKLSINLDRTISRTTGAYSGYYGGYYPGGGWSGSPGGWGGWSPGGYGFASAAQQEGEEEETSSRQYRDESTSLSISYQPSQHVSIDAQFGRRVYRSGGVGYLADSTSRYMNVGLFWQLSDALGLQLSHGTDRMTFLGEGGGTVSNRMLAMSLNYRPSGSRLGAMVTYARQRGSSPTYIGFGRGQQQIQVPTNLDDISGRIYYRIGGQTDLYLQIGRAKFEGGYAAFTKDTLELGLQRRINDRMSVTAGYRWLRNLTDESGLLPAYLGVAQQSQDYAASTFMVTLQMNFAGGSGRPMSRTRARYGGYPAGSITTFGGYSPNDLASRRGWRGYGTGYTPTPVIGAYGPYTGYRGGHTGFGGPGFGSYGGYGGYSMPGPMNLPGAGQAPVPGPMAGTAPAPARRPASSVGYAAPDPWQEVGDAPALF